MPVYDYHCEKCGNEFELIVFSADPDKKEPCPKCSELCSTFYPIGRKHHLKFLFNYFPTTDN